MNEKNAQGAAGAEVQRNRKELPVWKTPAVEVLPRLENLTLQTGAGIETDSGFTYV
jgi:hypothetical protein